MIPAYAFTARECIPRLEGAVIEAEFELTDELRKDHWQEFKGGPNAWHEVHAKALIDPNIEQDKLIVLEALCIFTDSIAKLKGLIAEIEAHERPINLKLGKMRR